jgi:hypothetical protein
MILGKMIKSSSITKKIPNDTIPFILMALSIIISFAIMGINGNALCSGIFSSAAAVGIHQQTKQGFKTRHTDTIEDDLELMKEDPSDENVPNDDEAKG